MRVPNSSRRQRADQAPGEDSFARFLRLQQMRVRKMGSDAELRVRRRLRAWEIEREGCVVDIKRCGYTFGGARGSLFAADLAQAGLRRDTEEEDDG